VGIRVVADLVDLAAVDLAAVVKAVVAKVVAKVVLAVLAAALVAAVVAAVRVVIMLPQLINHHVPFRNRQLPANPPVDLLVIPQVRMVQAQFKCQLETSNRFLVLAAAVVAAVVLVVLRPQVRNKDSYGKSHSIVVLV